MGARVLKNVWVAGNPNSPIGENRDISSLGGEVVDHK